MASDVDVRTRLKVDDQSTSTLKNVAKGYKDTAAAAESAKANAMGFAKQVAAVAIGNAIPGMIRGTANLATGWLKAANAAHDQEQALAGLYATMQELPWDESRRQAEGMRKQLLEMATEIGQAPDEVYRGYQKLLSFIGTKSDESFKKARAQTEQLTVLANVMGHNVESLAMEFGAMHDGVVRARGPLFQILKGTGVFGDNIAEAVTAWRKLTDEQRRAKLAEALDAQAKKINKALPTVSDLVNTFEGMKQLTIETIGEPVIKVLVPILKDLKDRMKEARPEIERMARLLGQQVGVWVKDAAKLVQDGFQYLKTHGAELKQDILDAFRFAKKVVTFIIDNKEAIAGLLAAKYAAGAVGGVGAVAQGGMGLGKALAGVGAVGGAGAGASALGGGGAAAGGGAAVGAGAAAGALAAFAAAIAGVGAAAWQGWELYEETWGSRSDAALNAAAKLKRASEALEQGNLVLARDWAMKAKEGSEKGAEMAQKTLRIIAEREKVIAGIEKRIQVAESQSNIGELVKAWNDAAATGNRELMATAANTIMKSKELSDQLKQSGLYIAGGIDAMSNTLKEEMKAFRKDMAEVGVEMGNVAEGMMAPGAAERLRKSAERRKAAREAKKAARGAAAMGGTSVNVGKMEIHQEFRDQDPDRVVFLFKKDLIKQATRRIQSRRATPFGL